MMKTLGLFFAAALVGLGGYVAGYYLLAPEAAPEIATETAPAATPNAPQRAAPGPEPPQSPAPLPAPAATAKTVPIGRVLEQAASLSSRVSGGDPGGIERVERRAATAAGRERLEREQVGQLLEEAFAAMLPERSFSPEEKDKLTDAVLRVRAARRVLKRIDPSRDSAEVLARERAELTEALAEFERVSGLPPSDLTELLEPQGGLSNGEESEDAAPLTPTEDDPEFLEER